MACGRPNASLAILLAITLFTGMFYWVRELEPKADVLWLHFIGYEWFQPARSRQAIDGLTLSESDDKLEAWRRTGMRWTYPMHAVSGQFGARFGRSSRTIAFGVGMAVPFLIGWMIFGLAARRSGEVEPLAILACIYGLTALVPGPSPTDHLLYYDSALKNIVNLFVVLLTPGGAFSPLSVQPKSTLLLFAIAAFALRRQGHRSLAYALVASGILWHAHLTVVLLGLLAAWDFAIWRWLTMRFPHWEPRDEALPFSGMCVALAAVAAVVYAILRSDQIWGVESALIQLSTRLLLLAESIALGYVCMRAWTWMRARIEDTTLAILFRALTSFVVGVAVLAAVGTTWDRGRYIPGELSNAAYIEQKFGSLAAFYDKALRRIRAE